jgi:hypothetical protein
LNNQQLLLLQLQSELIEAQKTTARQKQQWTNETEENNQSYAIFETTAKKLEVLVMDLQARYAILFVIPFTQVVII